MEGKPRKKFIGYWGQNRLSAALPWRWDRQGQHAVAGCVVTLGTIAAALVIPPVLAGFFLLAFVTAFLYYETSESQDINDWAWPDIFGWMLGMAAALPCGALLWWFFG